MFRPLELFIGLRYTRAKRRNQFISFISTVSIICICISVMALITVMSVMNGFDSELRSRISGRYPTPPFPASAKASRTGRARSRSHRRIRT